MAEDSEQPLSPSRPTFSTFWKRTKEAASQAAKQVTSGSSSEGRRAGKFLGRKGKEPSQGIESNASNEADDGGNAENGADDGDEASSLGAPTSAMTAKEKAQVRRAQVRRAQIQHRQRKADYLRQLEKDVDTLRDLVETTKQERLQLRRENEQMRTRLKRGPNMTLSAREQVRGQDATYNSGLDVLGGTAFDSAMHLDHATGPVAASSHAAGSGDVFLPTASAGGNIPQLVIQAPEQPVSMPTTYTPPSASATWPSPPYNTVGNDTSSSFTSPGDPPLAASLSPVSLSSSSWAADAQMDYLYNKTATPAAAETAAANSEAGILDGALPLLGDNDLDELTVSLIMDDVLNAPVFHVLPSSSFSGASLFPAQAPQLHSSQTLLQQPQQYLPQEPQRLQQQLQLPQALQAPLPLSTPFDQFPPTRSVGGGSAQEAQLSPLPASLSPAQTASSNYSTPGVATGPDAMDLLAPPTDFSAPTTATSMSKDPSWAGDSGAGSSPAMQYASPGVSDQLSEDQKLQALNFILSLEHICWDHIGHQYFPPSDGFVIDRGHTLMASNVLIRSAPKEVFTGVEEAVKELGIPRNYVAEDLDEQTIQDLLNDDFLTEEAASEALALRRRGEPSHVFVGSCFAGSIPLDSATTGASGAASASQILSQTPAWQAPNLSMQALHGIATALDPFVGKELTPVQVWMELSTRYPVEVLLRPDVLAALKRELVPTVQCLHFGACLSRSDFETITQRILAPVMAATEAAAAAQAAASKAAAAAAAAAAALHL